MSEVKPPGISKVIFRRTVLFPQPALRFLRLYTVLPEFIPKVLVAFTFLRPHEVSRPRLLRIPEVRQGLAAKLLTGQVESVTVNKVVAVNIPGLKWDSVNMAAENVLGEEGSYRALS